jgi:CRISPR-associated endoribonuclease Cas6
VRGRNQTRATVLRICSTTPALSRLLGTIRADDLGRVRLGAATLDVRRVSRLSVDHPLASTTTLRQVWHAAALAGLPGRVRLRFLSPTAFDRDLKMPDGTRERRNALFPSATLVFDPLVDAWNAAAASPEHDAGGLTVPHEVRRDLSRLTREEEYALETVPPVRFGRFAEKGFVGECEYSVGRRASPQVVRTLHALALFAFFTGIGMRTTMGMGQVICVRG